MTRLASSKCGYSAKATAEHTSVVTSAQPYRAHRIGELSATVALVLGARWDSGRSGSAIAVRSKPRAWRRSCVDVEGRSQARQPRRFGAPTITRVALRVCAYSSNVAAAVGPSQ